MEGDNLSAGAVVVHHDVVNADDLRIPFDELINTLDKVVVGGRAEKKINCFLGGFCPCKQNERCNQYACPTVDGNVEKTCNQGGDENE